MKNAEEMQISKKVERRNIQKENKILVHSNTSKKSNYKQNGIPCTLTFWNNSKLPLSVRNKSAEIAAF